MTDKDIRRWAAFFRDVENPWDNLSENFLLKRTGSKNRFQAHAAVVLLRHFGTIVSVPALKNAALSKPQDIQISAVFSLLELTKGNNRYSCSDAAADFSDLLGDKRFREKWAASIALARVGGDQYSDILFQRVKALTGRKRSSNKLVIDQTATTETLEFIAFCHRVSVSLEPLREIAEKKAAWFNREELVAIEDS